MSEHLLRPITNHAAMGGHLRIDQPFGTPTRVVRLSIEKRNGRLSGLWWPWTVNYAAEIHDLVHATGKKLDQKVKSIAYQWNAASVSFRHLMTADDLTLIEPGPGQARDEMRVRLEDGGLLRIILVPPQSTSRRHSAREPAPAG